jgi:succinate dehydrogenase hydrophobic anchor subunit
MEKILFKEEQRFRQRWMWLILSSTLLAIVVPLANKLSVQSWDTNSEDFSRLILLGSVAVLFIVAVLIVLLLSRLQTKITYDGIIITFPPLKRKSYKVKIQEIERFEIRTYSARSEFGGYGFRSRRTSGQAYIISGNIGLQLYFKNGKKLLIGTQKKQAIEFAMCKIMGDHKKLSTGERNSQHKDGRIGKKAKKVLIILAIEIVVAILIFGIIQALK